jgi:hypothetical protein
MIHKHFGTSRKHGALYDIEDLMAVRLVNDDLRGFITRWDAMIAGFLPLRANETLRIQTGRGRR